MKKHYTPVEAIGGMPMSATYSDELAAADHQISLGEAKQLISDFQADIMGSYDAFPLCETFSAAAIQRLLSVPGTIGLRIYNGIDENGSACFVLASVNDNGMDITMNGAVSGLVAENGLRYPTRKKPGSKKPNEEGGSE